LKIKLSIGREKMANYIKVTTAAQENGVTEALANVRYPSKEEAIKFAEQDSSTVITALKEFSRISGLPLHVKEADVKAAYIDDYTRDKQSVLRIDLGDGPRVIPVNDITSDKITHAVKSITFNAAATNIEAPVHAVKDEMKKVTYKMLDQLSGELDKIAQEHPTIEAQVQPSIPASLKPIRHR